MLAVKIDEDALIAVLEPDGPLSGSDFHYAATMIDPLIEKAGRLNGIIIHTETFPGWASIKALFSHLRFVKNHHANITRVALVTDSALGKIAERFAGHFVKAEVRRFPYKTYDRAREWAARDPRPE